MPALNPTDTALLQIASTAKPTSIPGVITVMQSIDGLLPGNDGLKWFNKLYLMVTQGIDGGPPQTAWKDPAWLTRLDVVFASYYFKAIATYLQGTSTASSWGALFESRQAQGIDRIQFALAGLNAHINHDLAFALIDTNQQMNLQPTLQSPEHGDYQTVNGILAQQLPVALQFLAVGILGELAQDTGKIGRLLAIWNVSAARDLAWNFADQLRSLPPATRPIALQTQDKLTGVIGRTLLLPIQ
jgi:Family of unknown function (DUF5995)